MALTLDTIILGVRQVAGAHDFYASAFPAAHTGGHADSLTLNGTGKLAFQQVEALAADVDADPATSGFRGFVVSSIVKQPSDVRSLLSAATASGASVIKPAKKQVFGEFTATYEAPDGALWKLAASSKKDSTPVSTSPKPTETAIYLGVTEPKASKVFYEALGMTTDRDYGDKFIDFTISEGVCRLGLLTRRSLGKDVGVDTHGDGFSAVVLTHVARSSDEVDRILTTAESAGGRVDSKAATTDDGGYAGYFDDLDGHHWKVISHK